MKENVLISLAIAILAVLCIQIGQQLPKNRYEVVSSNNMLTILIDKKTGNTWRNCVCSEKSNVPGCWEKMITINPEFFNKPEGEVVTTKEMIKLQKEFQKLQQKQAEKTEKENPKKEESK